MKIKIIQLLLIATFSTALFAQHKGTPYLFDNFERGTLSYKDGTAAEALFNYNTVGEKLIFMSDDSSILEIANPSKTTVVKIGERVFEHVKKGMYYERIEVAPNVFLYIRWHSNLLSEGKTGAYGTKTAVSSIDNKTSMYTPSGATKLSVDEDFTVKSRNFYYVKVKGKYKIVKDLSSLSKLFQENKKEIEEYVSAEKIDWSSLEDIKKAVAYCAKFIKE